MPFFFCICREFGSVSFGRSSGLLFVENAGALWESSGGDTGKNTPVSGLIVL